MSWSKYRRGRQTVIALPAEIKSQLIKNKALGGLNIGQQICEALRRQWGWDQGNTAAVTQAPTPAPATRSPMQQPIAPGSTVIYNGQPYRLQRVVRDGSRMPDWNL